MAVDIEVFGQLLPDQPRRRAVELQGPTTVRNLAHLIGLDLTDIGLITIDGVQSGLDHAVQPNARLCFFPYVSGG
jgi:hypothetical protein